MARRVQESILPLYVEPVVDMVNEPPHYNQGDVECIDAIQSALGLDGFIAFLRGQVIKYAWRCELKGSAEDAKKLGWYNAKLVESLEERDGTGHS